jgi:putative addiction module killer protein
MEFEVKFTVEFSEWLDSLSDAVAREAIVKRMTRIELGNFGDHASVGSGVSELRIHYGAGFRAYYTIRGRTVVFMLAGGTKRTQERDIVRAQDLAKGV